MAQGVKSNTFNITNCRQEEQEQEQEGKPDIHYLALFANCMQKQEGKPNIHVFANCMKKQEEAKPNFHFFANCK
jgi:hypothetical protein